MTISVQAAPAHPASVESRIGTLHYDVGCPRPETSRRLYDEMDFQRAVQDLGLDALDLGIADDVPDAVQRIRNVKVYPWSEREDPTPSRFVSISGALIDTRPQSGMGYPMFRLYSPTAPLFDGTWTLPDVEPV